MRASHAHVKGRSILGWVVVSPFILVALAIVLVIAGVLLCEVNKAYWDYRVKQMCEKDGGVIVYEKVELTREEYRKYDGKYGYINVPFEASSDTDKFLYVKTWETQTLRKYTPNITRSESIVYRKNDRRKFGKFVTYSRSGGDFPTIIAHPSGFGCRDMPGIELNIEKKIFSVKEN